MEVERLMENRIRLNKNDQMKSQKIETDDQ